MPTDRHTAGPRADLHDGPLPPAPAPAPPVAPPFYEGGQPFAFISYARADSALVFPYLERLHRAGVRFWYDRGIEGGQSFPDALAAKLNESMALLLFATETSFGSGWVRREVYFAVDEQKLVVPAFLCDVARLPRNGVWLALGPNHGVVLDGAALDVGVEKLVSALPRAVFRAPERAPDEERPTPVAPFRVVTDALFAVARGPGAPFEPLAPGTRVPPTARLRVVVRPDEDCHAFLVIETMDRRGQAVAATVFGPHGALRLGTSVPRGGWTTLPRDCSLEDDDPRTTGGWRVGLYVGAAPSRELLAVLERAPDAPGPALARWQADVRRLLPAPGTHPLGLTWVPQEVVARYGLSPAGREGRAARAVPDVPDSVVEGALAEACRAGRLATREEALFDWTEVSFW